MNLFHLLSAEQEHEITSPWQGQKHICICREVSLPSTFLDLYREFSFVAIVYLFGFWRKKIGLGDRLFFFFSSPDFCHMLFTPTLDLLFFQIVWIIYSKLFVLCKIIYFNSPCKNHVLSQFSKYVFIEVSVWTLYCVLKKHIYCRPAICSKLFCVKLPVLSYFVFLMFLNEKWGM